MNEIKIPQINFVPLKQGITDDELNEYMVNSDDTNFLIYLRCKYKIDKEWEYLVEAATCGFDDGMFKLDVKAWMPLPKPYEEKENDC